MQAEAPQAILTCGALVREIKQIIRDRGWQVDLYALPPILHNTPEKIPAAVAEQLARLRPLYHRIIVGYGDCGTGGALDRLLARYPDVVRLPGPHCYAMYGGERFYQQMETEPGTYFLTDYLARNFRRLVIKGNGLDRDPAMQDFLFANYRALVWLAQSDDPAVATQAQAAATTLGLPLTIWHTGLETLAALLEPLVTTPV